MAERKLTEGVGGWNKSMMFPKNRYTARCLEEDFGINNNGNPMITRKWELICPEPVEIGERKIDVDGLKITQYVITKVKNEAGDGWDTDKSDKAFGRFADELQKLGFDGETINDENPPCFAKGKVVDLIAYGKKVKSFQSPTAEQRAQGKKIGDPIKDASGKDVEEYQLQIDQILGLSTVESNRPY